MKLLWDFPEELQPKLIEISLSKYGTLVDQQSSPHSRIFTFDRGASNSARFIVAKGIHVNESMLLRERQRYLQRVLHEVNEAFAVCHHPSIHRFFDIELVYGIPFLLSRKRDATLRDVINAGPLPELELISIAVQIVHALNYCAQRNLVCHQDLKPENVFVDFIPTHCVVPAGYPLRCRTFVADFELANAYFKLRHLHGSRPYMAPEQYGRHQDGDHPLPDFSRVDVFALGVILVEMLTGGVHPVGKYTRLIWPTPAAGQSRKWLREDPWKQWLAHGATVSGFGERQNLKLVSIIRSCLETDTALRLSRHQLEAFLLDLLGEIDERVHLAVTLMLTEFDRHANEGEAGGWPYYSERLHQLNKVYEEATG
jgi:serine/threonine protein kinase